jgi:cysteine-rich repeat protein
MPDARCSVRAWGTGRGIESSVEERFAIRNFFGEPLAVSAQRLTSAAGPALDARNLARARFPQEHPMFDRYRCPVSSMALALAGCAVTAMLLLAPGRASAQPQDGAQRKCITKLEDAGRRLATAQGNAVTDCVKAAETRTLPPGQDAQACLTADTDGAVAEARTKTAARDERFCAGVAPDFGYSGSSAVNTAAVAHQLGLAGELFGGILDRAIVPRSVDRRAAICQHRITKAVEKYARIRLREFGRCASAGLTDAITDAGGLGDCISGDPRRRLLAMRLKIERTLKRKCDLDAFATTFPGRCANEDGTSAQADCLMRVTECRMCRMIDAMGDLARDCDEHDDGVLDGSCNGCGDGLLDTVEQCDDGNTADGDGCSASCRCENPGCAICGNAIIEEGEQCDDGNTTDGDGCSGACTCDLPCSGVRGCQCAQCPDQRQLLLPAGVGAPCSSNADCVAGICDDGAGAATATPGSSGDEGPAAGVGLASSGRCTTPTRLALGWTGLAHDNDLNDLGFAAFDLVCPGPAPTCGLCDVAGIVARGGACRCASDNQRLCDEAFGPDLDDCGGDLCECYAGPPLPLSSGNVPVCFVQRFRKDVTGTVDVDTGASALDIALSADVYLGETLLMPCPYCQGDLVFGDGSRDGTCVLGRDAGQPCDAQAFNHTFPGRESPAPAGGAYSLDCLPAVGKNISGNGLRVDHVSTTGTRSLGSEVLCGFPQIGISEQCHCGMCSDEPYGSVCATNADCGTCTTNADCARGVDGVCDGSGRCSCGRRANLDPMPNQCNGGACIDVGAGNGLGKCADGPADSFCDAILRANGEGYLQCSENADCSPQTLGIDAGTCSLTTVRSCFLDTISATGRADPTEPVSVAAFCIPPTGGNGVNVTLGLPGPAVHVEAARAVSLCASDHAVAYQPGSGGCP